jgi:hypothetical protein
MPGRSAGRPRIEQAARLKFVDGRDKPGHDEHFYLREAGAASMRVRTEIWVRAYLRRCQAEAIPVYVGRRGDEAAGAVFICVNRLDGTVALYGPAPAGLAETETERRWVSLFGGKPVGVAEVQVYLARQWDFDPDVWVLELEDRAGRHLLGDLIIEGEG